MIHFFSHNLELNVRPIYLFTVLPHQISYWQFKEPRAMLLFIWILFSLIAKVI